MLDCLQANIGCVYLGLEYWLKHYSFNKNTSYLRTISACQA